MWITAILMIVCLTVAARAGPLEDCEQVQDTDRRIIGCTDRIRQFPGDATAFFNRGAAYLSKGDLDRAIADNTKVIQIDPAYAPAYYHRGIAHEGRGQYDQAIADFSKVVDIIPRHGGAFDARARIHLKTNKRLPALRDAERAVSLDPLNEQFLGTRVHAYEALARAQDAIADHRGALPSQPSAKSAIHRLKRLGASSSALKGPVRKAKPGAKTHHYAAQAHTSRQVDAIEPRYSREEIECERARHADPAGRYAAYPCWAREAFSPKGRR